MSHVSASEISLSRGESLIDGIPLSDVKDRRKHGHKAPRPQRAGDNRLLLMKLKHLPGSYQILISARRFNQRHLMRVRHTVPGPLKGMHTFKKLLSLNLR